MVASTAKPILDRRVELSAIARRYGMDRLTLVGSRARGDARPDSDADFLYHHPDDIRLGFDLFTMENEMADVLKIKVESTHERAIPPHWREYMQQAMVLIFDDAPQGSPTFDRHAPVR